jgi:predicted ATPase
VIYGLIELGWAEAELRDAEGGIEKMQRGLAEYEAKLRSPYFLGLLADQLCKAGRLKEGLAVITKALTLAEYTGEARFRSCIGSKANYSQRTPIY